MDATSVFIKPAGPGLHNEFMNEIELKFQVPPARRAQVDAVVAGRAPQYRLSARRRHAPGQRRQRARRGRNDLHPLVMPSQSG